MVTVQLVDADTDGIALVLQVIAANAPLESLDTSISAYYDYGGFSSSIVVDGDGLTYNAAGLLTGGTITSINQSVVGHRMKGGQARSPWFTAGCRCPSIKPSRCPIRLTRQDRFWPAAPRSMPTPPS